MVDWTWWWLLLSEVRKYQAKGLAWWLFGGGKLWGFAIPPGFFEKTSSSSDGSNSLYRTFMCFFWSVKCWERSKGLFCPFDTSTKRIQKIWKALERLLPEVVIGKPTWREVANRLGGCCIIWHCLDRRTKDWLVAAVAAMPNTLMLEAVLGLGPVTCTFFSVKKKRCEASQGSNIIGSYSLAWNFTMADPKEERFCWGLWWWVWRINVVCLLLGRLKDGFVARWEWMAARIRRPGDVLSMVGVLSFCEPTRCDMKMRGNHEKRRKGDLRKNAHFMNDSPNRFTRGVLSWKKETGHAGGRAVLCCARIWLGALGWVGAWDLAVLGALGWVGRGFGFPCTLYMSSSCISQMCIILSVAKRAKKQGCCDCYLISLIYLHCLGSMLVAFLNT